MKSNLCKMPGPSAFGPVFLMAALIGSFSFLAGCGGSKSGQALEGQLKEMNLSREATGKFSGTVTVDGKPPRDAVNQGLFIILYDPNKPPLPKTAPLKAIVDRNTGHFEFTTYTQGDGVAEGSYIVLFVALKHTVMGKAPGFHEPDALKDLYNDPDKNKDDPTYNVTVTKPGKTDYSFDLKLEGQEKPAGTGPHSVTQFVM
jgi:hypothetical protein